MGDLTFERRVVVLDPGQSRTHVEAEWDDALVRVRRGTVELVTRTGACREFTAGAVLVLVGLGLRALRNPGPDPVVLEAVRRGSGSAGWAEHL